MQRALLSCSLHVLQAYDDENNVILIGLQYVQKALLSCSLHVLQAYDEGD